MHAMPTCTKNEMPSVIHSNDMIWVPKFKNGSHDPDHAHLGVVCHPTANAGYGLPEYKISTL